MDLEFSLHYSRFFLHQWERYDQNTRDFLQDKFTLIKQDPFRFPTHKGFSRIRKIKLSTKGKYQRLMFSIHQRNQTTYSYSECSRETMTTKNSRENSEN